MSKVRKHVILIGVAIVLCCGGGTNVWYLRVTTGSKRKIRWLFGFTEKEGEIEVALIHSVTSGKKVYITFLLITVV